MRQKQLETGMLVAIGTNRESKEGKLVPALVVATQLKRCLNPNRIIPDSFHVIVLIRGDGSIPNISGIDLSSLVTKERDLNSNGLILTSVPTNNIRMTWQEWEEEHKDKKSGETLRFNEIHLQLHNLGVDVRKVTAELNRFDVSLNLYEAELLATSLGSRKGLH
jgi:hypothetical protein